MTLRVAVDATAIPGERLGAGAYVLELLGAIDPAAVDLHVFVKGRDAAAVAEVVKRAELHIAHVSRRPVRMAWSHSLLPARVRRIKPDVFYGPHYTLPAGLRTKSIVMFHDPTFFTLPHLHERAKVVYFTRAARSGIERAARVIVPSDYAKRGAVEHAGARADAVDVVHEGVDLRRYQPRKVAEAGRPYILFVGALEPRKDVVTLVAAFDQLDAPHELVIVGPPRWGAAAVEAAISGAKKRASIRTTGYVPEGEKERLYQGASVFVYPSLAEGFGLPVLEAMACGAPVVTTTGSAPEEIAGDAALLVPPGTPGMLRDAIARVLADRSLAQSLRERGPERAQRFTWDATAAATVDVWRRAAGSKA